MPDRGRGMPPPRRTAFQQKNQSPERKRSAKGKVTATLSENPPARTVAQRGILGGLSETVAPLARRFRSGL